jgi:tRNA-dihydrouridine synthase A
MDNLKNYRPDNGFAEPAAVAAGHRMAVAPMLDWTDRHCRYLLRQLSRHTRLYTEMVTTGAIVQGRDARLLRYDACEHPVALQLGGSDPRALAACARIGADAGYDEINLNVGCPSDRVQSGRFGACLMAEPQLVADCVAAMSGASTVPVTVKCRIGIDRQDDPEQLEHFVGTVAAAGCQTFIIHARKAWLHGLSPKENRTIPPLRYDVVRGIRQRFPALTIVVNGGITSLDSALEQLRYVDGVMLGRAVYHDPWLLTGVDRLLFADPHPVPTRVEVVERMLPYIERELRAGTRLKHITRHMLGLFQGMPGARRWRRHLSEHAVREGADIQVLRAALTAVLQAAPDRSASVDYRHHYG